MSDQTLTDLLERAADRTDVGPPPLEAMLRGCRRRRRRHAVLGGGGLAVAAAGAAVLVPVLTHPGPAGTPPHPGTSLITKSPAVSPPDPGLRLHGRYFVVALVSAGGDNLFRAHAKPILIRFHDGQLNADTGCNEVSGGYRQVGDRFRARDDLGSTLVGCFPPDPPLASQLYRARTVARDQGGTYLVDAAGNVVVALHRP